MNVGDKEIMYTPGVGKAKAEILGKELDVFTQEDMLYYFPYKYIDRKKIYKIKELSPNDTYVQLVGNFISFNEAGTGRSRRLSAKFTDGTGVIEIVWFRGLRYISGKYSLTQKYLLFGKISVFGRSINIVHPDIETEADHGELFNMSFQPYYNTTEKMKRHFLNSKALHSIQLNILSSLTEKIPESLPEYMLDQFHLMPLHESLVQVHRPSGREMLNQARYRLIFEELFYIQLNILRYTAERNKKFAGYIFKKVGYIFNSFYYNHLPFSLTNAQKKVIKEIRADFNSGRQMNRLLQGDVGSGKTLVALMVMLIAIDNGYQACIMAPTEILAVQHYETLRAFLGNMNVKVSLLTGSTKKKDRTVLNEGLLSGDVNILVGTHAIIEDTVVFKNLGLAVIDEQHRFGVAQRSKLWLKNKMPPHILVMTATPIPRTLAMTVYGDLDVSVIDELPPGRKPVKTVHYYDNRRGKLYDFIREQIKSGRQVYIVYPLIKESENLDYKNLEDGYKNISEIFKDVPVCMVHGKMKPAEKEENMQRFVSGESRILVATTVIEVGVNVPNASLMVIESSERFGLSQLHQLRGRVGRGTDQSYCILISSYKLSDDGRKRLEIMTGTNDGFEIAEADMKLRGPGDMEGTQQSGIPFELKISNLGRDSEILAYVRKIAGKIIEDDPSLKKGKNSVLKYNLRKKFSKKINWGVIS